jgi:hypothetical protein
LAVKLTAQLFSPSTLRTVFAVDVLVPAELWLDGCLEVEGLLAALRGVLLFPAEGAVLLPALLGATAALLGAGRLLFTERCLLKAV